MGVWLDRAGSILFDAALSTALFLTIVVLAMLVCRQPSRRLLIARVAIVASLAMLPLVALVPLPRLDVLDTVLQRELVPASLIAELENSASASVGATTEDASLFASDLHDRLFGSRRWLPRSVTAILVACVIIGIGWLLLGFWGVRWLIQNSRAPSRDTQEIFDRLFAGKQGRRKRPDLRVSVRVERPVVVGLFRPTILLPASFEENGRDPELLRLTLLHEIAHTDGHDPWFGAIASLAQIVWFFVPQIWWLRGQLMIDQEFLADRSAARRYGTSSGYAASLLSLAASRNDGASSQVKADSPASQPTTNLARSHTGVWSSQSPLAQRVLMLLHCPFRLEASAPKSWSWALRITLVLATLVTACLSVRWPHAAALEHRLKHSGSHNGTSFRVTDFTSEPLVFSKGGQVLTYVMPVALPSEFEITIEVFSTLAGLSNVKIAGHPLGPINPSAGASRPNGAGEAMAAWHQVQLRRSGAQIALWINGERATAEISDQATTAWLTFEPAPDHPTQFRNLVVEW